MADENVIYQDGQKVLRQLRALCRQMLDVDASDQQLKQEVVERLEASRDQLSEGLSVLSRLV